MRVPAVVHVDLDGLSDISRAHGWSYSLERDPIYESGIRSLLDLFDSEGVTATFFVIAESLEDSRKRQVLREIVARGHEIASHTVSHPALLGADHDRRRREIFESRARIESELGVPVRGFRAPGYGLDRECVELLEEAGYAWDSSAYPTPTCADRLGVEVDALEGPAFPFEGLSLMELPLPDHRPSPVPINPSYALLLGHRYFRWGLERAVRGRRAFVLLFHLIDAADPVPDRHRDGWRGSLFTLSLMSGSRKRRFCTRVLRLVKDRCKVLSTEELVAALTASNSITGSDQTRS